MLGQQAVIDAYLCLLHLTTGRGLDLGVASLHCKFARLNVVHRLTCAALCKLSFDVHICLVTRYIAAIHDSQQQPTAVTVCAAVLICVCGSFVAGQCAYGKCTVIGGML